jgi:hypothetical protein
MEAAIAASMLSQTDLGVRNGSRAYAIAMIVLGLSLLAPAVHLAFNVGPIAGPGSAGAIRITSWAALLAVPACQLIVGLVLMAVAARYLAGRLHVPQSRVAKLGGIVSTCGLIAMLATIGAVAVQHGERGLFLYGVLSSAYLWSSALTLGIALVEGSRLVGIADTCEPKHDDPAWADTHVVANDYDIKPRRMRIDLRLGKCPNCKSILSMTTVRCHNCKAFFGRFSKWKVERLW